MSSTALSLYELAEEAVALEQLTDMDDGEWTDAAEALFVELASKFVMKADAFGGYIRTCESNAAACAAEVKRLNARKAALDNKVERLKRYGMLALQAMKREKVEGTVFTLSIGKNGPSVTVSVDAEKLPVQYQRLSPAVVSADKTAIAAALKSGEVIEGCELTTTYGLRVK